MYLVIFLISLVGLIFSGNWLVNGATQIAARARLSKAFIGLTIVSAGTSAPEFVVSLIAVLKGSSDLSVGNIVGSNIFNIALILGLTAIVFPLVVDRTIIRKDWPVMMAASLVFWLFLKDGILNRWEAGFIFVGFVAFILYSLKTAKTDKFSEVKSKSSWVDWGLVTAGIVGLAISARYLVLSAEHIATSFGISERIIGLTLFALGTSLPELMTSMVAAYKRENDIVLGNIIGSNLFNIMLVMSVVGMIKPITASPDLINIDAVWMLAISFALLPMMIIYKKITRLEGGILFAAMLVYCTFLFTSGSI